MPPHQLRQQTDSPNCVARVSCSKASVGGAFESLAAVPGRKLSRVERCQALASPRLLGKRESELHQHKPFHQPTDNIHRSYGQRFHVKIAGNARLNIDSSKLRPHRYFLYIPNSMRIDVDFPAPTSNITSRGRSSLGDLRVTEQHR